jgi:hypothetical protein
VAPPAVSPPRPSCSSASAPPPAWPVTAPAAPVSSGRASSSRSARKTRDIVTADIPELLVTGCRDTQTSADAFINGRFNGALTFALVQAIRKARGKLTYREWHDRAAGELKKRKFEQVPQLEGMAKRFDEPLFSTD